MTCYLSSGPRVKLGRLHDHVDQVLAGTKDHVKTRIEENKPALEGLKNKAKSVSEEQAEQGVWMDRWKAMMQVMVQASMDERLTATSKV